MITSEEGLAACTRAAEAHASEGAGWQEAVHHMVRSLIDRLAVARGLPAPGLTRPHIAEAEAALDSMGTLEDWNVLDASEAYQRLLELTVTRTSDGTTVAAKQGLGKRGTLGAWYTPPEVAREMCRLSIGPQLDRLGRHPDPGNLLQALSIDPACGAGVFLIEAARLIASRLAARVSGQDPAPEPHVRAALPVVMRECVFGVDIDPIAVDLAKTALWLEIDGRAPCTFMDRNVIVGNALADEMPPAFSEARGEPVDNAERRRLWEQRQRDNTAA